MTKSLSTIEVEISLSLPVPRNNKENDFIKGLMKDCGCLGIIRDDNNPYDWIDAYTQKQIKFELWSNSIINPVACMTNNGYWQTKDGCFPFCVNPLPEVLDIITETEINVCDYNDCSPGAQCIPDNSMIGV